MDDPVRAFLSRWVQADGRTILAVGSGRKADGTRRFHHVGFDGGDVDGPADRARREDARGHDVYLALARYGTAQDAKGQPRRTQENAFGCGSFQVDVDVKPGGYDTVWTASEAVARAGRRVGVGIPNLGVGSGNGLHAYWKLDQLVPHDRWHPLAQALVRALLAQGLRFDTACTKDIARILRIPGTRNWKAPDAPRPVSLLWDRGGADLARFEGALAKAAPPGPATGPVSPLRPSFAEGDVRDAPGGAPAKGETDELASKVGRKVDLSVVRRECLIMADAVRTGGERHGEPLWRDLLMLTIFGDDPDDDTAHAISVRHSDYSASETDAKLAVAREQRRRSIEAGTPFGPPTCERLDELWRGQFGANPHCPACAHRGHVRSPAYAPNRTGVAQAAEAGAKGVGFGTPGGPARPPSERFGAYWPDFATGGMRRELRDAKGERKDDLVTDYHVLRPFLARDERGELDLVATWSLHHKAGDPGQRVAMPVAHINDARLFAKVLGEHGIGLSDRHRQGVRDMYAAFTTQLKQFSVVRKLPKSLGWHDAPELAGSQGFVVAGKFWLADGTGLETSLASNPVAALYEPRGDLRLWMRAAAVILADPRPHVHAMVAISLGSILLPLVGARGAVSSFVSKDSGYGKSTMAYLAASIWGHPEKSTSSLNDTHNAVVHKAQFTGPLPTIFDDVRPGMWDVVDMMLFRFTQGKEKSRLSGSSQLQDAGTFDGALILTSNYFLTEMVQDGHLNAAALARITEHRVPLIVHAHDASAVNAALVTLKSNYALFGVEWVRHVLKERDRLAAALSVAVDRLTVLAAIHPTDREARFQVATAAAAMVAAVEARRLGLPVDPALARDLMVGKIRSGRVVRAQAAGTPQGVTLLVEFLEDQNDSKAVLNGPIVVFVGKRLPISYVVEQAGRRLHVDARLFTDWLVKRKAPVQATLDDLKAHHHMAERPWVLGKNPNAPALGMARRRVLLMPCIRPPLDTLV